MVHMRTPRYFPERPVPTDGRSRIAWTGPEGLWLPVLRQIARITPQHALQLLARQPAPQQSPHVHLGSLDERLTKALVQTGAALRIGSGDVRLWIAHDDEGSAKPSRSR
jgi:hypothetical protein